MKALIALLMMTTTFGISQAHADQTTTKEVNINIQEVFIPDTVTKDTDISIVLSGLLPSSCYSYARSEVVNQTPALHLVHAVGKVTTNTMCLMMMIPYSKELKIGKLPIGDHTFRFENADETYFERTLTVQ